MYKKSLTFILVCFGISLLAAGLFYKFGTGYTSPQGLFFATAYMFIPLVSVVITQLICGEKPFKDCGISFKVNRWWFIAWLGLPLIPILGVCIASLFPGVSFSLNSPEMQRSILTFTEMGAPVGPWGVLAITLLSGYLAGCTVNALAAFGEEVAWRGFLDRSLSHLGFWRRALLIGFVWGVWHAPLILMGHNFPMHRVAGVFVMTAFCMAAAPLFLYLRQRAGSVIVAAIVHGTFNAVAGLTMLLLVGGSDLLTGSCGAGVIAALVLIDIIIAITYKPVNGER